MIFRKMFSRHWILTTVLVVAGAALCARLGIWQLDRLAQRRAFNSQVLSMRAMPPIDISAGASPDLVKMEYRAVTARGTYDFANQVALRNQYHDGLPGYHLFTPLRLADGTAVFVDRGWIPAEGADTPAGWSRFDGAAQAEVQGVMRLGPATTPFGGQVDPTLAPGQTRLDFWNFVNLDRLARQTPYPILQVYIQEAPAPDDATPPIPVIDEIDLSEGPHMGYAIQWFGFATMLLVGYPFYLRKQEA